MRIDDVDGLLGGLAEAVTDRFGVRAIAASDHGVDAEDPDQAVNGLLAVTRRLHEDIGIDLAEPATPSLKPFMVQRREPGTGHETDPQGRQQRASRLVPGP